MVSKCVSIAIGLQVLLCICLTTSSAVDNTNEDLLDFEFESGPKNATKVTVMAPEKSNNMDSAFESFFDDIIMDEDDTKPGGHHIQEKEMRVRKKLVRAWKNPNMQRKFAEVLPILKVMTGEQKVAFAALVSAQVGAKQGRELNLDQVGD